MVFNTGAALLDAIVLAVVSKEEEGTYGYKITQDVRSVLEVSESTLYPVLRRLQKDECLETWHMQAGTADTTRSQRKEWHSLIFTELNGRTIQPRLRNCLREA